METLHVDCLCSHFTHSIRLILDEETGELVVETHLNDWLPWYRRVWLAIKYVLGARPHVDGHYDTTILKVADYPALREMLRRSELASAGHMSRQREHGAQGC